MHELTVDWSCLRMDGVPDNEHMHKHCGHTILMWPKTAPTRTDNGYVDGGKMHHPQLQMCLNAPYSVLCVRLKGRH